MRRCDDPLPPAGHPPFLDHQREAHTKGFADRGLGQPSGASVSDNRQSVMIYPILNVIAELDLGKWTSKVEVKYFGRVKGKGLVAKEKIE